MKFWKQLDRRTIYDSKWLKITLDKLELPDGRIIEDFELMHYPNDTVGVVAVNNEGKIILVRAYRYLHESFDWELPGGVVEVGEDREAAALRELMEETGYKASTIKPLIEFFPHKGTCSQKFYIYQAEGLEKVGVYQEEEITEVGLFTEEEILDLIESGEINESMSLVSLQRYFSLVRDS